MKVDALLLLLLFVYVMYDAWSSSGRPRTPLCIHCSIHTPGDGRSLGQQHAGSDRPGGVWPPPAHHLGRRCSCLDGRRRWFSQWFPAKRVQHQQGIPAARRALPPAQRGCAAVGFDNAHWSGICGAPTAAKGAARVVGGRARQAAHAGGQRGQCGDVGAPGIAVWVDAGAASQRSVSG